MMYIPPEIHTAMQNGAALAVSISGGKDSHAMLKEITEASHQYGWEKQVFALHMDLGRAEWKQTPLVVTRHAAENNLPLVVVRRPQGDLVQEIQDRMEKLRATKQPFWPSSSARYCTADQKRAQADKVYRNLDEHLAPFWPSSSARYCTAHHKTNQADKVYRNYDVIISAEGLRAAESPARAKKNPLHLREQITAAALRELTVDEALTFRGIGQRVAINWYPIFDYTLDQVWETCGTSRAELETRRALYKDGLVDAALDGWPGHPAYVFGNERLSCALCVLASENDIRNGAAHNPELFETYRRMEIEGGSTFKNGKSLADIVGYDVEQIWTSPSP